MKLLKLFIIISSFINFVNAYGKSGHYIIGKATQLLVNDNVTEYISKCSYLDVYDDDLGLASLYADNIKGDPALKWTSKMHYYSLPNNPPEQCITINSTSMDGNVKFNLLKTGTVFTKNLQKRDKNNEFICKRFNFYMLLHMLQDLHQPLHLTGKLKGGNGIKFSPIGYNKSFNLHSFWDTELVKRVIEEKSNGNIHDYVKMTVDLISSEVQQECQTTENQLIVWANTIEKFNCELIWLYENNEKYLENAIKLTHLQLLDGIRHSVCYWNSLVEINQ